MVSVISVVASVNSGGGKSLARPKSRTLTSSPPAASLVTNKLDGFRSRWTMFSACAAHTASQTCSRQSIAAATGSGPSRSSFSRRSWPTRYSITRYGSPDVKVPASRTRTTWALFTRAAACASRRNRATAGADDVAWLFSTLSATRSLSARWYAAITIPIPPSPTIPSTRYRSATTSPGRITIAAGASAPLRAVRDAVLRSSMADRSSLAPRNARTVSFERKARPGFVSAAP